MRKDLQSRDIEVLRETIKGIAESTERVISRHKTEEQEIGAIIHDCIVSILVKIPQELFGELKTVIDCHGFLRGPSFSKAFEVCTIGLSKRYFIASITDKGAVELTRHDFYDSECNISWGINLAGILVDVNSDWEIDYEKHRLSLSDYYEKGPEIIENLDRFLEKTQNPAEVK